MKFRIHYYEDREILLLSADTFFLCIRPSFGKQFLLCYSSCSECNLANCSSITDPRILFKGESSTSVYPGQSILIKNAIKKINRLDNLEEALVVLLELLGDLEASPVE